MISPSKQKYIKKLFTKLRSLRATARLANCSPNTVRKYVDAQAVNTPNRVFSLKEDNNYLQGLFIGLWLGDGSQFYDDGYVVKICSNKENALLNYHIRGWMTRLFGVTTWLILEKETKRAHIKCNSQFVFEYVLPFVQFDKHKTRTVQLKTRKHSKKFLSGCLLGLMLSDGYLKDKLLFNVVSPQLAQDMIFLLRNKQTKPSLYIHKRKPPESHLHMVRLRKKESQKVSKILDNTLEKLGCTHTFNELKYEKK